MSFPPTESEPLTVTTRDGRVVCCCVRSVGKVRPHLRWLFAMAAAGQEAEATTFTGPVYVRGDHDSIDAVRGLVDDWWETTKIVGDANDRMRPRIRRG